MTAEARAARPERQAAIEPRTWAVVIREGRARRMSGTQLMNLIAQNWVAKRWPLELMPEERQEVDRGAERSAGSETGSVEKSPTE